MVRQSLGDFICVLAIDMEHCRKVDPLIVGGFPGKRFPLRNGNQRFLNKSMGF